MISNERILAKIKFEEGLREWAYRCSAGKLTIGYGYNLDAPGAKGPIDALGLNYEALRSKKDRLPQALAEKLLQVKIEGCVSQLRKLPFFEELSDNRQLLLIDMCYQMGLQGLKDFHKMWQALGAKDYKRAAVEMLDSKWAKKDSPNRAKRNFDLMVKG